MKKIFLILLTGALLFGQTEILNKIRIDRRTESLLARRFESLPNRVELYITADSIYVAEAYYENQKVSMRFSATEYREMLKTQASQVILENARTPYLIGQSALSIGLYSWSLPIAIFSGNQSSNAVDRARMATTFFTPFVYSGTLFLLSRNTRISSGAAYGSFLAGIEGAAQGGMLFNSGRTVFSGSIVENFTDFYLGQRCGLTPGMFQRKFNHTVFAYGHLLAVYELTGMEDDLDRPGFRQIGAGLSLVEGYTSLYFSRNAQDLSYGDALFELRTSMLGSEAIPLILLSIDFYNGTSSSIDKKIYSGTALAGFVVGYYIGYKLTAKYDISGPSGIFTYLIPYLAHGLSLGTGALIDPDFNSGSSYWRAYPIIFDVVDIGLTAYVYKSMAKPQTQVGMRERGNFNFYLNPAPLFAKNEILRKMPICGVQYHF
jgi:hypothetical protein